MRRIALLGILATVACGTGAPAQPNGTGDPAGERAFFGAFQVGGTSMQGTCVIIFPPRGQTASRARCNSGPNTVDLTGPLADGTINLSGTSGALTWGIGVTVGNTVAGIIELGGLIAVHDDTLFLSGRVETLEATLEPASTYCGTFTTAGAPQSGGFIVAVRGGAAVAADGEPDGSFNFLSMGTRTGSDLRFGGYGSGYSSSTVLATATISPTTVTGALTGAPRAATFEATECPGANNYVCCGNGAATRCCFQAACPCP